MTKDQIIIKELLQLPLFVPYFHSKKDNKFIVKADRMILASDTNQEYIQNLVMQCKVDDTAEFCCFFQGGPKDLAFGFYPLTYFGCKYYRITVLNKTGLAWSQSDVDYFVRFLQKKT
jgi:hypothetical protein